MSQSGEHSTSCENLVRFYYGERTGESFKKLAFDDFEDIEADLHEEHLIKHGIDYLRIDL